MGETTCRSRAAHVPLACRPGLSPPALPFPSDLPAAVTEGAHGGGGASGARRCQGGQGHGAAAVPRQAQRVGQAGAGRRARACRLCRGRRRRVSSSGSRPCHPSGRGGVVCARSPGGGAPAGPEGLMRVQLGGFSSAADRQWHPTRGLPRRRVPRPNPWRSSSCWRRMLRCTPPRHLIFPSPSTLHCWGGPREACGNERACQTWSSSARTGQRAGTYVT